MNFYTIDNPYFDLTPFGYGEQIEPINRGSAIKCEECGSFLSMLKWLPPFNIRVSQRNLGDFIYGSFSGFVVSQKFKQAFELSGLYGLSNFRSVNVYYKGKLIENERFYYPDIKLSDARVDIRKSGIVFEGEQYCSMCQSAGRLILNINGIFFETPGSISEDIFSLKIFGGCYIVSERFKEFIYRNNFANIKVIDATTYIPIWLQK